MVGSRKKDDCERVADEVRAIGTNSLRGTAGRPHVAMSKHASEECAGNADLFGVSPGAGSASD